MDRKLKHKKTPVHPPYKPKSKTFVCTTLRPMGLYNPPYKLKRETVVIFKGCSGVVRYNPPYNPRNSKVQPQSSVPADHGAPQWCPRSRRPVHLSSVPARPGAPQRTAARPRRADWTRESRVQAAYNPAYKQGTIQCTMHPLRAFGMGR